ncbi:hypothetical protein GJAV_G00241690 [Gymnothorax javanicus]|nr:hypothetical protein GJAV_G00241690 [Gymnothorax javanicus]
MDEEHVSSTTADIGDLADAPQPDFGAEGAGLRENNEALAKHAVDDDINSDLIDGESDAIEPRNAEEDPSRETVSESSSPESQAATEPGAPLPPDCAVAESKQEPTKLDTEDSILEPEKEESRIEEPSTEDKIIEPETEDSIAKPETEDKTTIPPETEDAHRPDAPVKAPASVEESPLSSRTAEPHETIISSSAASPPQLLSPTANVDALHLQSQGTVKDMDETSKDLFSSKAPWHETDMLSSKADSEDDFLFERKATTSPNNPFHSFAPVGSSGSGLTLSEELLSDSRAGKMSESPTPDLVQYAHDTESQESASAKNKEAPLVDLAHEVSDAVVEPSDLETYPPTFAEESEKSSTSPSLPDILRRSPLNPDKEDSGSSEGSSDSEKSPFRQVQNAPDSAAKSFGFDSKVLLLKEMAEETEARAAEKKKHDEAPTPEQSFGTFDLVKEAETTAKGKGLHSTMEEEEKDWMFSTKDSVKLADRPAAPILPSSIDLPSSPPPKNVAPEESDSDSPITDSLSPVLDAMAKNPESFQVEIESGCLKESRETLEREVKRPFVEEPEAAEEMSEHEASSEEFEFVEKPPKGLIDEFLETLDNSKQPMVPERGPEYDLPTFGQRKLVAEVEPESEEVNLSQMPHHDLNQLTTKADLEKSDFPSNSFERDDQKASMVSDGPLAHPAAEELLKPTPVCQADEHKMAAGGANLTKEAGSGETSAPLSQLRLELVHENGRKMVAKLVVDLLYWRDIKTTGVVFGASLFLLLSLTVCSIVSVCSYVALTLLSVTITFRIYKGVLQAVQKSDEGHPFKAYLDQDVALSEDVVHKYSDMALERVNAWIAELRRLFLVEDLVDSLKFAVGMWVLTYVGALFNGLTLIILALIAAFSCPVIYEKNQKQIDHYLELVTNQFKDIVGKVQAKVPGLKRKTE